MSEPGKVRICGTETPDSDQLIFFKVNPDEEAGCRGAEEETQLSPPPGSCSQEGQLTRLPIHLSVRLLLRF